MVNSQGRKKKKKLPLHHKQFFSGGVMFLPLFFGFCLAFISSPCLCPLKVCAAVPCTDKSSLLPSSLSFLLLSPAHPIIPLPSLSISAGFHHPSPVSTNIHPPLPPPPPHFPLLSLPPILLLFTFLPSSSSFFSFFTINLSSHTVFPFSLFSY